MKLGPIPETLRIQAAELFWEAFSNKLGKILGPSEKGVAYFASTLNFHNAIGAISDDDMTLLGLIGYDIGKGGIIGGGYKELAAQYGYFGGLIRGLALELFVREVEVSTLHIDGIAVHTNYRNKGIGQRLLQEVEKKAREADKSYILLDVINTNPRAKALYERENFKVIAIDKLKILQPLLGFSLSYKMRKKLD